MWSLGAAHELPPFDVIFLGEPEAAPPASLLLLITWCVQWYKQRLCQLQRLSVCHSLPVVTTASLPGMPLHCTHVS